MRFLIVFFVLCLHLASAQVDERKKGLNLAFAIWETSGIPGGSVIIPTDYVLDKDGKIVGQKYLVNSFSDRYTISNEGTMSLSFEGDKVYRASQLSVGCSGPYIVDLQEFGVTYNDQGQITKLAKKYWGKTSKDSWVKDYFVFEYANGKISKLTRTEIIGSGKSSSAVTMEFEYPITISTVEWKNDNEVAIITTTNRRRSKKKDPTTVMYVQKYVSRFEKGKLYNTSGAKQEVISEYVTNGNQVTSTSSNAEYKQKTVTIYTHDARGLATSIIVSEYKDDKLTEKKDIKVQYTLKESGLAPDVLCNYKTINMVSVYDGAGTLTQEATDQGIRVRNADGTWGPWKGYTY